MDTVIIAEQTYNDNELYSLFGELATYTPKDGGTVLYPKVMVGPEEAVDDSRWDVQFGERLDLSIREAEVAEPVPGDSLVFSGGIYPGTWEVERVWRKSRSEWFLQVKRHTFEDG